MTSEPASAATGGTEGTTGSEVTRARLKACCDQGRWDLLDRLLEQDRSLIDDDALFTDDWGLWWGMLFETVCKGAVDGVRVLLKHGARRELGSWGDGESLSPLQAARDHPEIVALLMAPGPADDRPPSVHGDPDRATPRAQGVDRQGELRDRTGLVFRVETLASSSPAPDGSKPRV